MSSGDDGAGAPEPEVASMTGHASVISLDNIPMASKPEPVAPDPVKTAETPPSEGGLAPPQGAADPLPDGAGGQGRTLAQLGLATAQEPGVGIVVPSTTKASSADVVNAAPGQPLPAAPVDILVEQTEMGLLPRIAEAGGTAFDTYARPETKLDAAKPKVAIIVTGLGLSRATTEAALSAMPQEVAMALNVYARGLDFWVARAREDGHEVLLSVPLETSAFPFRDPGPDALRVLYSPEENVQKLHSILGRTAGYFGI